MNQYIPYKKQKSIDIPLTGEIIKLTWSERNQSKDQILKQLENYIEIGIIEEVPLNTYVRYLTLKDRKITLRYGGFLKIVKNDYIILENNGKRWNVQRCFYQDEEPIFYTKFFVNKKYSFLLDRYNPKLEKEKDNLIDKLKEDIDKKSYKNEKREKKLFKQRKQLYDMVQDKNKEIDIKCDKLKTYEDNLKKHKCELENKEDLLKLKDLEIEKMRTKLEKMKNFIKQIKQN